MLSTFKFFHSFIPKSCSWLEGTFWALFIALCTAITTIHPELFNHGGSLYGYYIYDYLQHLKLALLALSLFSLFLGYRFLRHYRIMEDTPRSKIKSCAQGFAELEGVQHLLEEQPIIGKLSKQPRTWYRYQVEQFVPYEDRKGGRWRIIDSGTSSEVFALHDNTGVCIINPQNADVKTNKQITWSGYSPLPEAPPPKNRLMRWIHNLFGDYRYTEQYMEPGTTLYAVGMFNTENGTNFLTNNNLPERHPFVLSAIPQQKLIRSYKIKFIAYILLFLLLLASYPQFNNYYFKYWKWLDAETGRSSNNY